MNLIEQLWDIEKEISQLTEIEDTFFREEVRKELHDKKLRLLNLLTFKNSLPNLSERKLVSLLWDISKESHNKKNIEELDFKTKCIVSEVKRRSIKLTLTQ